MSKSMASQREQKNSKSRKKILCGTKQLVIRVNEEYREKIHHAARASGLTTRQFVLGLLDRAIKKSERKTTQN